MPQARAACAELGGVGRRMPFVCAAFIVGALALAGLPPLNGFWSKELVLEAGLARRAQVGAPGRGGRSRCYGAICVFAWCGWYSSASDAA